MCIQDIQLGRKLRSHAFQTTAPLNPNQPVVAPDPNRTRLIFSTDGTVVCRVWPGMMGGGITGGFALSIANPRLVVRVEEFGKLVMGTWLADDGGNGTVLTVVESTLEEQ